MYCHKCGKNLPDATEFCFFCGVEQEHAEDSKSYKILTDENSKSVQQSNDLGVKIKRSYIFPVISAVSCFILRLAMQSKQVYYNSLLDNRYVVGIDRDIKPFLTFIPVAALIVAALLIVSDKENSTQSKQWGVEHRQPHSSPFVCIFPYLPRLASASSRHLRKNPKQKSLLWGAAQFSRSSFSARQVKSRREYPLYFQGIFRRIGGKLPVKTYRGSTPHCLRALLPSSTAFYSSCDAVRLV